MSADRRTRARPDRTSPARTRWWTGCGRRGVAHVRVPPVAGGSAILAPTRWAGGAAKRKRRVRASVSRRRCARPRPNTRPGGPTKAGRPEPGVASGVDDRRTHTPAGHRRPGARGRCEPTRKIDVNQPGGEMARYDLDYGRGYGQDYSRSGWRRSSAGSGYRRYGVSPERMAGRSRYGREYGRFREGRGFR